MVNNYYNEEKKVLGEALKISRLTNDINKVEEELEKHVGFEEEKEELISQTTLYLITKGEFWPKKEVVCYIGSAGIGKTSFVQRLADSLERPLILIPLSGLKELKEFTILGEEGNKPSLIAWAIKTAGCRNPIILLDELEKVEDEKIQADLIELFSQYKNKDKKAFNDPYFKEKIDLSHLTFFATVNNEDFLAPLLKNNVLTRYLPDYTRDEKVKILQIKREQKEKDYEIERFVSDESIDYLAKKHIQEGGIRKLDQALSKMAEEYVLAKQENRTPFQGSQKQWIKENIFPYQESFKIQWHHWILFSSLGLNFFLLVTWIFRKFVLKRKAGNEN